MRAVQGLVLALAIPAVGTAQTVSSGGARSVAAAEARRALAGGPIAGLSIAVVQDGRMIFASGYGLAELENRVAATEHTVFRINSITKAFTAALILRLEESGKLRLDDPLSRYLPEYTRPGFDPTLRQILTHTGGITNYGGPTFARWIRLDLTAREWVDSIGAEHLYAFPPGADWSYSNAGYDILGLIAEKVSGLSLDSLLRQQILKPAGMSETYRCNTPAVVRHRASSYEWKEGRFIHAQSWGTYGDASGRLCSTVTDLARFFNALENGTVLNPHSLASMRGPGRLRGREPFDYGLGTRLGFASGHRLVAHTGSGESWTSCIVELPDRKLTVIALANTDAPGWPAERVAVDVLRSLARLPNTPPQARPAPAALVDRMLGRWRTFGGSAVEMLRDGDHLGIRLQPAMRPLRLLYLGGMEFRSPADGSTPELHLFVDTAGARTAAGIYGDGIFRALALRDTTR